MLDTELGTREDYSTVAKQSALQCSAQCKYLHWYQTSAGQLAYQQCYVMFHDAHMHTDMDFHTQQRVSVHAAGVLFWSHNTHVAGHASC